MYDEKYGYNCQDVRGGITLGYHMLLGKGWNAEFTAGFGVAVMNHNKLDCHY